MRAHSMFRSTWRACAATLLLCFAGALHAQATDAGDPPDRVARLSYLAGDVGLLPSGATDWGEAGVNRPLTRGDKLSSSAGARAELELDGAALRLDGQTDVGFLALDDQLAQLELTQGTLSLTVRQLGDGQSYEIDTPTVALVVDRPGRFRVDVDANGRTTRVTAFDGNATVYGENDAERTVVAGRSYRFADSSLDNIVLEDIGSGDDFDAWSDERDRRYADSQSSRYVSEEVIGYQDLDNYGEWRSDPDYGTVWYPAHVDVDWAPYRNGHWAWVGPWGWTWVDDAPWGFAPYHYGRWAWRSRGWCWVPGPRTGWRPVYAPALVAFVGGRNWSVSVGGGAPVGWFPLGPGDVYNPWYRGSRRYYTEVNVTNIYVRNVNRTVVVDRIGRHYDDWRRGIAPPVRALHGGAPRGFTAVPARNFADADRVQRHRLQVDPRHLAGASVLTPATTPRPTARSFAPQRAAQARPLPARSFDREVVARHPPRADASAERIAGNRPGAAAPDNVRLLQPRAGTLPAVTRFTPAGRTRQPDAVSRAPARGVSAADRPGRPMPGAEPPGPGELRSARFVRDREPARAMAAPAGRPPVARPGVSFIPGAEADRAAQAGSRLPATPRFAPGEAARPPGWQRAPDVDAQARAANIENARRAAMQREGQPRAAAPSQWRGRDDDSPRRFDAAPDVRAMRPTPQAAPMPRAAPPPRSRAAAAPPRARHEAPHRKDDAEH